MRTSVNTSCRNAAVYSCSSLAFSPLSLAVGTELSQCCASKQGHCAALRELNERRRSFTSTCTATYNETPAKAYSASFVEDELSMKMLWYGSFLGRVASPAGEEVSLENDDILRV